MKKVTIVTNWGDDITNARNAAVLILKQLHEVPYCVYEHNEQQKFVRREDNLEVIKPLFYNSSPVLIETDDSDTLDVLVPLCQEINKISEVSYCVIDYKGQSLFVTSKSTTETVIADFERKSNSSLNG